MTCVAYRGAMDIDVQFEDGTLAEHKAWNAFLKGYVRHPHVNISNVRIGVKSTAANGMQMTCIAYRSSTDIDIQFKDGTVIKHKQWRDFIRGNIRNPHVGTSKV